MQKQNVKWKIDKIDVDFNGWYEVSHNTKKDGMIVEGYIGTLKSARLFKKMLIEQERKKNGER